MKYGLFCKGLIFGIILLFIGIGIQPSIIADISIESDNSDLIEITIQICKSYGAYDHKVTMSREQSEELENLIKITKTKLDAAETIEETSHIFNETVVLLYELGVLPDCMSIEDAQLLVNGKNRYSKYNKLWSVLIGKNLGTSYNEENHFCLLAGSTTNTTFIGPIGLFFVLRFPNNDDIHRLILLSSIPKILNPIALGNTIYLGSHMRADMVSRWSPSIGWIYSIGLNGTKKWDGKFYGRLPEIFNIFISNDFFGGSWWYPGVLGFTGIRISLIGLWYFYLGTALKVEIGEEPL
jgi:hypothetical protein